SSEKLERCRQLGLQHGIASGDGLFSEEVKRITGGAGADVVLELVGGNYAAEDLECIAMKGRIILIGLMAGAKTEMNLGRLLMKRARMFGTTLRARPLEEKIAAAKILADNIVPLLESGAVKPIIDRQFDISDAMAAHEYLESND